MAIQRPRPPRSENLFKRNDLRRALRSAREEGIAIERFEIDPHDGRIIVYGGKPAAQEAAAGAKAWDDATEQLTKPKPAATPAKRTTKRR